MRHTSIASILPWLMLGNSKQDLSEISILISKYGHVKHYTAADEKQKIAAGAVVLNSGKLKLAANASVVIFSNGKYIRLAEAGVHELNDLAPGGGMQKLNFDARFNNYLLAAVALVIHAEEDDGWGKLSGSKTTGDGWGKISGSKTTGDAWGKLSGSKTTGDGWGKVSSSKTTGDGWGKASGSKTTGDGWGKTSASKTTGDGWGDHEGRIVPILPFGKLSTQSVVFQWSQPQISQDYILEMLDESGAKVFSSKVKDNWTHINLRSLPLEPDVVYDWRIHVPDHPEKSSAKVRISINNENVEELLEDKLKKSDAYQIQDPVLSSLMEAVVLEEADYFYEAHQRYELLRQSFKKNNLVKLMQALFYLRHQLKPKAERLF